MSPLLATMGNRIVETLPQHLPPIVGEFVFFPTGSLNSSTMSMERVGQESFITPSEIGKMSEKPFGAILLLIVACIYIQNTFTPLKDCPQNVLQKSHFLPKEGCS